MLKLSVALGQKRLHDCNSGSSAKKQKRNQKRLGTSSAAEKNGAGKRSDQGECTDVDSKDHSFDCKWFRLIYTSKWRDKEVL